MEIIAVHSNDFPKTVDCGNSSQCFINKYHDFFNSDLSMWMPPPDQEIKYIKVNFLIIQKSDGSGNFSNSGVNPISPSVSDEQFLIDLIDRANYYMGNLSDPSDNAASSICGLCNQIKDTRIRYMLTDIRYFQSDAEYGSNFVSNTIGSWLRDDEINLIVSGCDFDFSHANLPSLTNHNVSPWVFCNRLYQDYITFGPTLTLNSVHYILHETGHNFGLCHTYFGGGCATNCADMLARGYYFDDVYGTYSATNCAENNCCWNTDPYASPSDGVSNNIMSVTVLRHYYSPKQVGAIHRFLSLYSIRNCVVVDTYDSNYPLLVNEDEVWDFDFKLYSDIIIESGNTLTIKCNTRLPKGAKIIVEPGASLIVDGGVITNHGGGLWQGIELQGDATQSQGTPGAQGQIIMKNGAVIENAREGIITIANCESPSSYDYSKTGGIIKAENSTFRNCKKAIQFYNFDNTHPTNGNPMQNISYIKNCTFETTENLPNLEYPYAFVSMNEVDGVKLYGNIYQNTNPSATAFALGMGIYSVNSSFTVGESCLTFSIPCNNTQESYFINLNYGIRATTTPGIKAVTIKNSVFDLCHFGVYLAGMEYPTVINNEFIVDDYTFHMVTTQYGYGLYLNQCNNYKIEGNEFHSPVGGDRGWTGIYVNNSNTGNGANTTNEIYRNSFNDLYSGIVALNDNDGPAFADGLAFHCETFLGNTFDIAVLPNTNPNTKIGNLQGHYIYGTGDASTLSRNWYSAFCIDRDEYQFKIDWYPGTEELIFHANYAGMNWQPECYDPMIQTYSPTDNISFSQNDCPDNTIINPIAISSGLQVIFSQIDELNNLIDGGQTALMVSIAQSNIPDGQMLQTMLEFSPYLSDDVLLALIDRPVALAPGTLKQILEANSPLSDEVYQAVLDMRPQLPTGILNQIIALQTGEMSAMDILAIDISTYSYKANILEADLVRYYLNDTLSVNPLDSVALLLEDADSKDSKLNLVSTYIEAKNFARANSLLDSLVYIDSDLDSYADKQRLNIQTINLPGNEHSIASDSIKMQELEAIANDTQKYGAIYAQNTLEMLNDTLLQELTLIPMPDINNRNMVSPQEYHSANIEKGILTCFPNPAGETFTVRYEIDSECSEMFIVLNNSLGIEISRFPIEEYSDDILLKSPELDGTYYVYIESCGNYIAIDKIVIIH